MNANVHQQVLCTAMITCLARSESQESEGCHKLVQKHMDCNCTHNTKKVQATNVCIGMGADTASVLSTKHTQAYPWVPYERHANCFKYVRAKCYYTLQSPTGAAMGASCSVLACPCTTDVQLAFTC